MTEHRLRADLDWVESSGDVIALDRRAPTYLAANPAASVLWHELCRGTTRARLVELLDLTYHLGRERAAADVDRFLGELQNRELLS